MSGRQREKEEEDGETSKTYVPEALAPSTESVSTLAGATPPNEEEEFRPPRSIAAITNEEKLKRAERRKAEGKGRKHDQDESDSDFEMNESEDPEEEEEEEEEESEDASDDEYSEGERSRRRSSRESGASRRREHYDKETLFYVNGTLRERNFSDGGNASPSSSLLHAPGSAGANGRMAAMLDKSAASKRKYNRFNRRNLSFDDRCQQLVEFKHTYGHCHVKRTHPGETKGLAYWVERQRMAWRKGTLELDKKKRLDDIGFVWEAGTNGSGSDELREYEALHASNRIKAEFAESQSNLLAEPPGAFEGGHYEGSESAAQRDPAEGDAPAAGGRGEAERSVVTGEAPVPREESRERSRDDTVTRRGRLKLEEAKSFDDWCALLQQFKDKHGHCDVKRRYFGKNKGLAYWAERQRASRRKGSLEEEKINKLDSMGFVWGNNDGTVTPRKSSNGNDSMDYSFDASADGEMEETASPMEAASNDVATTSTTTSITITPPPAARHGVPRAVASALEDLDSGRQHHHQDSKKALEWERVHRKDREQLELLKRKLEEEERRARNREKKSREEKREWEEESINLQLENCLLKEKLLTLDEELRANSQGTTTVSAFSAKRKRHDEAELVGQDLTDEMDAAEKRRKTTEAHEGGDAAAADGQKALLPALPAPAHVSADKSSASSSSSSTEPTDLWALLCALEGHLRSLVHDQKAIATHQRVLLDMASTVVATSAADVTTATAADVDTAADSLISTGGSEADVAAPTAESSTPAEMMEVEGEGKDHAAPVLDETDKETRATVNETALIATSEQMETAGPEQAVEPPQQGETESVAASEPPPVQKSEEDPQPSL